MIRRFPTSFFTSQLPSTPSLSCYHPPLLTTAGPPSSSYKTRIGACRCTGRLRTAASLLRCSNRRTRSTNLNLAVLSSRPPSINELYILSGVSVCLKHAGNWHTCSIYSSVPATWLTTVVLVHIEPIPHRPSVTFDAHPRQGVLTVSFGGMSLQMSSLDANTPQS